MKKLYRSRNDRMWAGVLGGVARYFNIDSSIVRLGFILLLLATGVFPFVILYIIAIYVIPEYPRGMEHRSVIDEQ